MTKFVSVAVLLGFAALAHAQTFRTPVFSKTKNANFTFGFVLPIHKPSTRLQSPYDMSNPCGELDVTQMIQVTYLINLLDEINARTDVLPNVRLGYSIIDSCSLPNVAVSRAANWDLSKSILGSWIDAESWYGEGENATSFFHQRDYPNVDLVIGGYNSRVSLPLAVFLNLFGVPLIDTGATLGDLSDRRRYPLYARVTPSDINQAAALAAMAHEVGHQCVHIVYSEGLYGEMGAEDLRDQLAHIGICVVSDQKAPTLITSQSSGQFEAIVKRMKENATVSGVICFCEETTLTSLFAAIKADRAMASKDDSAKKTRFAVIGSDYWAQTTQLDGVEDVANGGINIAAATGVHDDNGTYSFSFDADTLLTTLQFTEGNPWLTEYFQDKFACSFDLEDTTSFPCNVSEFNLDNAEISQLTNIADIQMLYASVMASVDGLDSLLNSTCEGGQVTEACVIDAKLSPDLLVKEIISQEVDMSLFGGTPFHFDENGDGIPRYEFKTYQKINGTNYDYWYFADWTGERGLATYKDLMPYVLNWPGSKLPVAVACTCPKKN